MATRFDSVTTKTRPAEAELDLQPTSVVHHEWVAPVHGAPSHVPRQLPARVMGGAMLTWLSVVFGLCYVALPATLAMAGLSSGVLGAFWFSLPAFLMASVVAVAAALVYRPQVRLDWAGPRDPVFAATLGGLGVWAVIHNTSALLLPFSAMTTPGLASFMVLNVIEMAMLGMMFASFTKRHSVAFALGGGFQLLMMGLALTLMAV